MWSSATSTVVARFSNPTVNITFTCSNATNGTVQSDTLGISESSILGFPYGAYNTQTLRDFRQLSADNKQPVFYVASGGGEGVATYLSPENDVGDVFNQWTGLTEANPTQSVDVYIGPGSYPGALLLNQWSTLRPNGVGTAILGQ